MGSIILGIIIILIGTSMVIKAEGWLNTFGRMDWFEEHLGVDGGSRLGYKLLGLIGIFLGTLIMLGLINGFLGWILSPLLRYQK